MHLIVGLGNPGKEYEKTRHNMGFVIIDKAISNFHPPAGGPISKLNSKFKAEISKSEIDGEKIILAKPQTFMNASGVAIKKIATGYELKANSLFVVHDDLDLPLGKIKISFGAGSAGHNGVQSIIDTLGTKNFWRLRIGIAPSPQSSPTRGEEEPAEKFVLKNFSKEEQKILKDVIARACEALTLAIKNPQKAMSLYNQ